VPVHLARVFWARCWAARLPGFGPIQDNVSKGVDDSPIRAFADDNDAHLLKGPKKRGLGRVFLLLFSPFFVTSVTHTYSYESYEPGS